PNVALEAVHRRDRALVFIEPRKDSTTRIINVGHQDTAGPPPLKPVTGGYCRCVGSAHVSNGIRKGASNTKNGNKYLSRAFIEAAHFAIRYEAVIRTYYQRKQVPFDVSRASW
ncbi:MAG: IS110 family transposase, partial [Nitrospira sp.]|nr:IS110 family transposase [Nitrospira sp.]